MAETVKKTFFDGKISTGQKRRAKKFLLHTVPGWGKTSLASEMVDNAEDVLFLLSRGEDGLFPLIENGIVRPEVRYFDSPISTWQDAVRILDEIVRWPAAIGRPKMIVIDTLNGVEELCRDFVIETEYQGNAGDKGYAAFAIGDRVSLPREFAKILQRIDAIAGCGIDVFALCHTAVKKVNNPFGADFDRCQPALAEKVWEQTARRFDAVFFGTFAVSVQKTNSRAVKGKGAGGEQRKILTQPGAAWEAKTRFRMPPEIDCGSSAIEASNALKDALYGPVSQTTDSEVS